MQEDNISNWFIWQMCATWTVVLFAWPEQEATPRWRIRGLAWVLSVCALSQVCPLSLDLIWNWEWRVEGLLLSDWAGRERALLRIVHCTELLNLVPPLWILLCKQLLMFPFHLNCKMVCLPLAFYGTALPSFCYCYNKIGARQDRLWRFCFAARLLDGRDIQVLCLYFISFLISCK